MVKSLWHIQYLFGLISLFACLLCMYVHVCLIDTLLMHPQPLVRVQRASTAVTTCTAFLTAGFVTMTTTARTILTRETAVSERKEETAERKDYQKRDGESRGTCHHVQHHNTVFLLQIGPQWVISQCNCVPEYLVNDLQEVCIIHSPWRIERDWLHSLWMNVFQSCGPVTRVTFSAVAATASLSASNATATLTVWTSLMKAPVVSVLPCFFFLNLFKF